MFSRMRLRDDGRQEAVERLLGAAIGIIDQVGQGVDHRPGQGRRIADFQPRFVDAPLGGHVERDLGRASLSGRMTPVNESILSMPWT